MEYLPLIIMVALLGIMAFFLTRSKKKYNEWIATFSQAKGYRFNLAGKEYVFEISSDSGSSSQWSLKGYSRSSTSEKVYVHASREYTEWEATGHFEYGENFIIPRDPTWRSFTDEKILSLLIPVWIKMGIPAEDFTTVTLPDERFMQRYMIITSDRLQFKKLFNNQLQKRLEDWMNSPLNKNQLLTIHTSRNKIQLQTGFLIHHPDQAEQMIQTGLSTISPSD